MYRILLFLLILNGLSINLNAQIFVRQLANGNNDGSSWQNAFTDLQDALSIAAEGDEIWIAKGIYTPVQCDGSCDNSDRNVSFEVSDGIKLYGGFEGIESSLDQRDWETNKSILSGDIGIGGDDADNSFTLIEMTNVSENTVIDGLTITNANHNNSFANKAGGIYIFGQANENASPKIENCSITNNYGERTGGVKIIAGDNAIVRPEFINNRFENNRTNASALGAGGALNISLTQSNVLEVHLLNCTFLDNISGSNGGGVSISVSNNFSDISADNQLVVIDSCYFKNNQVISTFEKGAAIYISGQGNGSLQSIVRNSSFIENQSGEDGGAIAMEGGGENYTFLGKIFNNYFHENQASRNGGALMTQSFFNDKFNVLVANNIFENNQAQSFGGAIYSNSFNNQGSEKNVDVINNTFFNNLAQLDGLAIYNNQFLATNEMDVVNNIFAESAINGDEVITNNGGTITLNNNLIKAGLPTNVTDNGNNIFTDPDFLSGNAGDFHLRTSSPAINVGDNNAVLADTEFDFDGNLRIRHQIVDMGAYETGAVFVDLNATGNNTGLSWQDAFVDLQSALAVTKYNKEIWVAQGTYFPTSCQNDCTEEERAISFQVPDSVRLFGGFNATENEREQRNWEVNTTLLSGDIGVENDSTDNTYSVITMQNSSAETTIDGFVIERGFADASGIDAIGSSGGGAISVELLGVAKSEIRVNLRNLVIRNNFGGGGGGIRMIINGGIMSPQFSNILFEKNSSSLLNVTSFGGAVMLTGQSIKEYNPVFLNCYFKENRCGNDGGALALLLSNNGNMISTSTRIDSCIFEDNVAITANSIGGAIYNRITSNITSQNIISNTLFLNNKAGNHGGAVNERASFAPAIASNIYINCTFSGNATEFDGGAIYFRGSQEGTNESKVINSIFNNNSAQLRGGAIFSQGSITGDGNNPGDCLPEIINNTFFNNNAEVEGNSFFNEFAAPTIANNIIWGNDNQIGNNNGTPSLINNIIEGGYNGTGDQVNTLDQDPQFIDANAENFDVSPCSPAINNGENEVILETNTTSDFKGGERIFDEFVDIGAIEWNGVPERLDSIGFSIIPPSFESASDGLINAEPFNGTPDYNFLWSTGDTESTIDGLGEGTYILTVTDAIGCQFTDSVELIAIPNTIPEIISDSIVTAIEDELYIYTITVVDPDEGDTLAIFAENLPDWLALIDNGDGTATLSGIPENDDVGLYNMTIIVNDSRGGTDEQIFDLEVINVNDPPEFTSLPDTIAIVGVEYIYNITVIDIDVNDILSITMPFVPDWLSFEDLGDGTAILSGTPQFGDAGNYAISLIVTDNSGANDLQFFNLEVILENETPVFTSTPVTEATAGEIYNYEISASDGDEDAVLFFNMVFLPSWLNFIDNGDGTATLEGIPQINDIGTVTLQITVSDQFGAESEQIFDLMIIDPDVDNTPPEFISNPDTIAIVGQNYNYNVAVTDIDQETGLIIEMPFIPSWLNFTDNGNGTASINGTPSIEDIGNFNISIFVTDNAGATTTQNFVLVVILNNSTPEFTSLPVTDATVGINYVYTITAVDPDNNAELFFSIAFLPTWLSFTDNGNGTAVLEGVPTSTDIGNFLIQLVVQDQFGAEDIQDFNLLITDPDNDNIPPEFTSIPVTSAVVGENYSYPISATDQDGNVLVFSMPFVPGWLNFTDNGNGTALLEGIPQPGHVGNFAIQIFVEDEIGATTNQSFEIVVTAPIIINEPPQINQITLETQEDQSLNIIISNFHNAFTDVDNDPIGKIYIETLPVNGRLTLNGNQLLQSATIDMQTAFELIYIPNENFNGTDQWIWNADDNELKANEEDLVKVVVIPVNDPPTALNLDNQTIAENAIVGDLVGILSTQDVDLNDDHSYYFSNANNGDITFFSIEDDRLVLAKPLDFNLQNTYEIQITVEDSGGETFTAQFTILVEPVENEVVANAITPNGDGKNDEWLIPEVENCSNCKVEIFNRWGQMVFSSIGYDVPWDGYFNNKALPTGTYYYLIDFNGVRTKTGSVSILK